MKLIIMLVAGAIIILALLSCSRDLTNPLDADSDLDHQPKITSIQFSNNQLVLSLDWSYSNEAILVFERKSQNAFEPIAVQKLTASTFADNTLNLEQSYNLVYRVKVTKSDYQTDYSAEKTYNYNSTLIYPPTNFTTTSVELQGVRLNWQDNSSVETGYKIQRSLDGSSYSEIADITANSNSFLHVISGMPATTLSLAYRVKAYNASFESTWVESTTEYSGLGAPTNLVITDTTAYHFTIAWTRNSTIADNYEIEQKKDNGNYETIQSVGANTQSYSCFLSETGIYSFRVRAKMDNVYSTYSNVVSHHVLSLIPTIGMVAYYPFNNNASDESGNANNGILVGAEPVADRFDNSNSAYKFNIGSYIRIPYSNNMSFYSAIPMTYAFWFKSNSTTPGCMVLHDFEFGIKWNGMQNNMEVYDGYLSAHMTTINTSNITNNNFSWHHIAVVRHSNRVRKIYLDSSLIQAYTNDVYSGADQDDTYIGWHPVYWGSFTGFIDDMVFYNVSLSDIEIQALYHEGGWAGKQ